MPSSSCRGAWILPTAELARRQGFALHALTVPLRQRHAVELDGGSRGGPRPGVARHVRSP